MDGPFVHIPVIDLMFRPCLAFIVLMASHAVLADDDSELNVRTSSKAQVMAALYRGEKVSLPKRKIPPLSRSWYGKKVQAVYKAFRAWERKKTQKSEDKVVRLLSRSAELKELGSHEKARIWELLADFGARIADQDIHKDALRKMVSHLISEKKEARVRRRLLQFDVEDKEYEKAMDHIDSLVLLEGELSPETTLLKAHLFYLLDDMQSGLDELRYTLDRKQALAVDLQFYAEQQHFLILHRMGDKDGAEAVLKILTAEHDLNDYPNLTEKQNLPQIELKAVNDLAPVFASTLFSASVSSLRQELDHWRKEMIAFTLMSNQPPEINDEIVDHYVSSYRDLIEKSPAIQNLSEIKGRGKKRNVKTLTRNLVLDQDLETVFAKNPVWPRKALNKGLQGNATVKFAVDPHGEPIDIIVIEAEAVSLVRDRVLHPDAGNKDIFNQAVIDAIRESKFRPAILEGEPITVRDRKRKFSFAIQPGVINL